jgi:very-long-chain ceramide synthase
MGLTVSRKSRYFRHYLNLVILYSVWTEYDPLVPPEARFFRPLEGLWLAGWMKYQVFVPIALLQLVNLFWYYLM